MGTEFLHSDEESDNSKTNKGRKVPDTITNRIASIRRRGTHGGFDLFNDDIGIRVGIIFRSRYREREGHGDVLEDPIKGHP
mmetsp:Transcript_5150/g.5746  ORF Transcript_5150/g.5746 Transcript_5150/m.5746 type:complete len:81 (-) Transcript_5150:603-845(-)